MKLILAVIMASILSGGVFAETLQCVIKSGQKKSQVTLNLEDSKELEEGKTSNYVYDLSFYVSGACENDECETYLTIYSGIVEDEVASDGFTFKRFSTVRNVYNEELTNAPDGKPYRLVCTYNP